MLDRRSFLFASGATAGLVAAGARAGVPRRTLGARRFADTVWHDVRGWGVSGRGWSETERYFDRFPAKAKGVVRDVVWDLSRHSAGMSVECVTDATTIRVRYSLLLDRLAMAHMPATGVSGLDLYGLDGDRWRWGAVFKPGSQQNEGNIISGMDEGTRRWRIYLPLYNGTDSLEIGVPRGAAFEPVAPAPEKPVVFYGTSILHGACASRPGMAWPSIVGRGLGRPTINLGFSGNGKMEPEVAALLAELDAAAFVIDAAPNMNATLIRERAVPLVRTIRDARPGTPIILVEDRNYGYDWLKASAHERNQTNHRALREAYERLRDDGVTGLEYVPAESLLGEDYSEMMTDGSHPNDGGMLRYAAALTPVLRAALGGSR